MPEKPTIQPRTIVALALLAAAVILGYEGVVSGEIVASILVAVASGYGFMKKRSATDGGDSNSR
jgi:hypothetical protein